jgi:hypothetical protein
VKARGLTRLRARSKQMRRLTQCHRFVRAQKCAWPVTPCTNADSRWRMSRRSSRLRAAGRRRKRRRALGWPSIRTRTWKVLLDHPDQPHRPHASRNVGKKFVFPCHTVTRQIRRKWGAQRWHSNKAQRLFMMRVPDSRSESLLLPYMFMSVTRDERFARSRCT